MEYTVISKHLNGDYTIFNEKTKEHHLVDLFVDDSCDFDSEEDIIDETIIIEDLEPLTFFARNVKLKDR